MGNAETRRVLFAAYYFPPRGGAGVQRSLKFVKYLRRFGWEPTVLTTDYGPRRGAYDESLLAEVPDGTEVVRVPGQEDFFLGLSRIGLGRLSGLTVRPDFAAGWVKKAFRLARKLHSSRRFDAVYTSVQPWSIGLLGMRLKESLGLPWVCDFRDPWARSLHLTWPTRLHWKWDFALEGRYLARADRTVMVTETMREIALADHGDIEPRRIVVIENGYDEEDMLTPPEADDAKFTIVFTGKFQYDASPQAESRTLRQLLRKLGTYGRRDVMLDTHSPIYFLEALAKFLKADPERRRRTRVVFAGTVGDGNMALVERLGLSDVVEWAGYVPHSRSVALVKSADALLLPMFSTGDESERVPYASGKVYEYIAARRPVLALAQAGDAKDTAERSGLGLAAPPRDVEKIADCIGTLYEEWRSPVGRFQPDDEYIASFTRERLTARLAGVFDEACGSEARQ